jgi:putative heme iron utilization protein
MSETASAPQDHGVVEGAPSVAAPAAGTLPAPRCSAAEESRTLVAGTNIAALATLTADGDPWASLVTYGTLADGAPVLCLSRMAEHGRNLDGDGRASVIITQPHPPADPLAAARVTLAGRCERAIDGEERASAREAYLGAVEAGRVFVDFSDFSLWILRVQRVRWVGGYGRMDSATAEAYGSAAPDPVMSHAASAVAHLNADHADALLDIARTLGGYPDATRATCDGIDRYGMDLSLDTGRGQAPARVAFPQVLTGGAQLRSATVELTQRARASLGAGSAR